jgi:hypothetical protein
MVEPAHSQGLRGIGINYCFPQVLRKLQVLWELLNEVICPSELRPVKLGYGYLRRHFVFILVLFGFFFVLSVPSLGPVTLRVSGLHVKV